MRAPFLSILLVALFALSSTHAAEPCFGYGLDATGLWQLTDGTAESTVYVDDHGYTMGEGVWIWQEANGLWTPKLPGAYSMPPWWAQDDLQLGGCAVMDIAMCDGYDYPWSSGCVLVEDWPDLLIY